MSLVDETGSLVDVFGPWPRGTWKPSNGNANMLSNHLQGYSSPREKQKHRITPHYSASSTTLYMASPKKNQKKHISESFLGPVCRRKPPSGRSVSEAIAGGPRTTIAPPLLSHAKSAPLPQAPTHTHEHPATVVGHGFHCTVAHLADDRLHQNLLALTRTTRGMTKGLQLCHVSRPPLPKKRLNNGIIYNVF